MLPPNGRSAKILQEGSCERRRPAGTLPKTLEPRPRGYARGVSMAGGGMPLPFPSVGPPAVGRRRSESAPGSHAS